jgi:hypothetical protein
MTPERFRALLDAYGADPRRWPEAERDAARAFAATDAAALRVGRDAAAMLDRGLDAHEVAGADAALIERIVAMGPSTIRAPRAAPARPRQWLWPRAGWALTGLAGALAGALVVSVALGERSAAAAIDWQRPGTAFTERSADWSDE